MRKLVAVMLSVVLLLSMVSGVYASETLESVIPDANLRTAVIEQLENQGLEPTKANLKELLFVVLYDVPVTSLKGLELATNLYGISIWNAGLDSIDALKSITTIEEAEFGKNNLTSISALANSKNLEFLYVPDNKISDLSPLKGLTRLTTVDVSGNNIQDISVLADLPKLGVEIYNGTNGGYNGGGHVDLANNFIDLNDSKTKSVLSTILMRLEENIPQFVPGAVRGDTSLNLISEPQKDSKDAPKVTPVSPVTPVSKDIAVTFNGVPLVFDQPPVNINGSIMVPLRVIFDAYGADIVWNAKEKTVYATLGETKIFLTVDDARTSLDGNLHVINQAPVVINNRVLVPTRFIAEAFGSDVQWDADSQTVKIVTSFLLSDEFIDASADALSDLEDLGDK